MRDNQKGFAIIPKHFKLFLNECCPETKVILGQAQPSLSTIFTSRKKYTITKSMIMLIPYSKTTNLKVLGVSW